MRKLFFSLLAPIALCGFAINSDKPNSPWFTGPLLTPSSRVVPADEYNLEPYFYWTVFNGFYNEKSKAESRPHINQINNQLTFRIGLAKNLDLAGSIQSFYTRTRGVYSSGLNDSTLGFNYQLYLSKPEEWFPNVRLTVIEVFPTGKYQRLKEKKLGTDSGGDGAFLTILGITFGKVIHIYDVHYLSLRLNFSTTFKGRARVKGFNTFGGDSTTFGKVFIGSIFVVRGAFEYSLTRNWVLACDFQALYSAKDHFRGKTLLPVGGPSNSSISLAPAIEYNFNSQLGIIAGSWFTIDGRNAARFISTVVGLNYNF